MSSGRFGLSTFFHRLPTWKLSPFWRQHERRTVGLSDGRTELRGVRAVTVRRSNGPTVRRFMRYHVTIRSRTYIIDVGEGQVVEVGEGLVVVEAMKMENELRASSRGVVEQVHVSAGQRVEKGAPLVTIKVPEPSS